MTPSQTIALRYINICKLLVFFLAAVALYLYLIINFQEDIFIGRFTIYLVFAHYFALLSLIVVFVISIAVRLIKLAKTLKESHVLRIGWPIVLLGYVVTFLIPPLWFVYLVLFWILAKKHLL